MFVFIIGLITTICVGVLSIEVLYFGWKEQEEKKESQLQVECANANA